MSKLQPDYKPQAIEQKWQAWWQGQGTYKTEATAGKPKYYVLDMFPYPSGAGLHVGHPLGYIASDIFARYKRLRGYNVLHPMGFDAFGLPAEQYAIQTGQHPAVTTKANTERYRQQLDNLGFSFDWERQVSTADPAYYKWTQWIFIQLFHHGFDKAAGRARPIQELEAHLALHGTLGLAWACDDDTPTLSAEAFNQLPPAEREAFLQHFRLAFTSEAFVNWCPALGTVLANDEVKDGFSERGGYPVERKKMRQFMLRITAYADRLIEGLDGLDWTESIKEQQRNWIGRSTGATVQFAVEGLAEPLTVFTTRPDTLYGVSFMVLAPEHEAVAQLTTPAQKAEIEAYVEATARRSELDRKADTKRVSGAFTGSFAQHPLTGQPVPIWIADYVLAGYGTGAVMGVPSSDTRDFAFASHFGLPIVQVQAGPKTDITAADFDPKAGTLINSPLWEGQPVAEAIESAIGILEARGLGQRQTQYRLRDAVFGRQRYWGEPIPVYYKDGVPHTLPESALPLLLPEVDKFLPTAEGEPPLARAENWTYEGHPLETTTMPGWAGSSWYFLRYADPHNTEAIASPEALAYWGQVDLYLGGSEHATGHLLYARFWHKFLADLGLVQTQEPFQKLVNQGMIQGVSAYIWRERSGGQPHLMFPKDRDPYETTISNNPIGNNYSNSYYNIQVKIDGNELSQILIPIEFLADETQLSVEGMQKLKTHFNQSQAFYCDHGLYLNGKYYTYESFRHGTPEEGSNPEPFHVVRVVEKMSKSKYNVVNPDDIVARYGADTLRLYEMFLGPLEQSKPWNTSGIEGVAKFLRKFYRLFVGEGGQLLLTDAEPSKAELKVLHKTLQKVADDIEKLSFNTIVSALMIAVNELTDLKCHARAVLEPLTIALAPLAPHLAEELWQNALEGQGSVHHQAYPAVDSAHLVDDTVQYPISFNGKTRVKLDLPADFTPQQVEAAVLAEEQVQKYLAGAQPKKVIVVPKRMVNLVV